MQQKPKNTTESKRHNLQIQKTTEKTEQSKKKYKRSKEKIDYDGLRQI